jgi:hypothetical protein
MLLDYIAGGWKDHILATAKNAHHEDIYASNSSLSLRARRHGGLFGLVNVQAAAPEGILAEVQRIVLVSQGRTYTAAHLGMTLASGRGR